MLSSLSSPCRCFSVSQKQRRSVTVGLYYYGGRQNKFSLQTERNNFSYTDQIHCPQTVGAMSTGAAFDIDERRVLQNANWFKLKQTTVNQVKLHPYNAPLTASSWIHPRTYFPCVIPHVLVAGMFHSVYWWGCKLDNGDTITNSGWAVSRCVHRK